MRCEECGTRSTSDASGVRVDHRNEVAQHLLATGRPDRLRVELHAHHRMLPMADGMDLRLVVARARGNLQHWRQRRVLADQRVIAHDLERVREPFEQTRPVMPYARRLAMHDAAWRADHSPSIRFPDRLVSEADPEDRRRRTEAVDDGD